MWLSEYIKKALGFSLAYFRTLGRSAFDLVHDNVITKSQFGRFYWVSLFICAFSLFYYYVVAQQYDSKSVEFSECTPSSPLPFFAFFVLAEVASFVLLVGAQIAGWGMVRIWNADTLILDQNLKLQASELTSARRGHVIGRRLYGQMWGWFPITLALAVAISQNQLASVVSRCADTHLLDSLGFLTAVVWPGLVVAFTAVAALNWCLFRWGLNMRSVFILSIIFVSYVVATAVAGPADQVLSRGFRAMPEQINSFSKLLLGGKIFDLR